MERDILNKRVIDLKNEIMELENINQDSMIDVDNDLKSLNEELNKLLRLSKRKINSLG